MYYKLKARVWVCVRGFVRSGHVRVRVRKFISESSYAIMSFLSWPLLTSDDPFIILTSVDPSWPQMTLSSYWLQLTLVDPRWLLHHIDFSWPQITLYIIIYTCFRIVLTISSCSEILLNCNQQWKKSVFTPWQTMTDIFSFLIFETFQIFLNFWYFASGKVRL